MRLFPTIVMALAFAARAGSLAAQSPSVATEIRALLDSSAAGWNRGDVRAHLVTNSDSIRFMTRRGPVGERFALVVGQFILSGGGREEQRGWFSTVWERHPEGWRVIHDHSS